MNKRIFCLFSLLAISISGCTNSLMPNKDKSNTDDNNSNNNTLDIRLTNNGVNLALSTKQLFEEPESELTIKEPPTMEEFTYAELPPYSILDSENTPYDYGSYTKDSGQKIFRYIKYTFYIKNVTDPVAIYDMQIKPRVEKDENDNGKSLLDTLRFMVCKTTLDGSCEVLTSVNIYAKEASNYNIDIYGDRTMREFISTYPAYNQEDDEHRLADSFESDSVIVSYRSTNFPKNYIDKYTFVIWLEGADPESNGLPPNEKLFFDVDITANAA